MKRTSDRLFISIPLPLKKEVQKYVKKQHTSVSHLVRDLLMEKLSVAKSERTKSKVQLSLASELDGFREE